MSIHLVQSLAELPRIPDKIQNAYIDFETTSGDPKRDSLDPWHHCGVAGIGFTYDDCPDAWYIPIRHAFSTNLPVEAVFAWLQDVFSRSANWVNHNVKYDAHVALLDPKTRFEGRYVCTMNLAKILDSEMQFKGGYGLDNLARVWLNEDIRGYEEALRPYLNKNKDYGNIPADVIGPYGGMDVLTCRKLYKYLQDRMPSDCSTLVETEIDLTRTLIEVEQDGLNVSLKKLAAVEIMHLMLIEHHQKLLEAKTGRIFRPHVAGDCYDVLCNQYGLPVLGYTDEGNPSFEKQILDLYAEHPLAPREVVKSMIAFRHSNTLISLFTSKFMELAVDGKVHPQHTQNVRTGRLACKRPNSQQCSSEAKELIDAEDGFELLSADYSQIEFRFIVHYIKNQAAINAYNENPDTDFHKWVADVASIPRKPAKTTNFLIAFGGGKGMLLKQLTSIEELVGSIAEQVRVMVSKGELPPERQAETFNLLATRKAEEVYNSYHNALPTLKPTAKAAESACKTRGYVFNIAGRRRYLPPTHAYKAFNFLNQSSAADYAKQRFVAIAKGLARAGAQHGIRLKAFVHDEFLFQIRKGFNQEQIERLRLCIASLMETSPFSIRVPIRANVGWPGATWRAAADLTKNAGVDYSKFGLRGPLTEEQAFNEIGDLCG